VLIRTPGGAEFDVADPALADRFGAGVRVIKNDRGTFDTMPLSLLTVQSVAALGALTELELDVRRFRPNFMVDAPGEPPFAEDTWEGATLTIGGIRMRVDKRDERCMVVNLDPVTLTRTPAVLRAIATHREVCFGVYGSTARTGRVAIGDDVSVETP
jgi:uncharacterized protein YcbX